MEKKIQAVIDNWVFTQVHDSPLSRDVDAYNHLESIISDLVTTLVALYNTTTTTTEEATS
jgi:hypothetical protein